MIACREAILIAIAGGDLGRHPSIQSATASDPKSMVEHAQAIADAACEAWGHAKRDGSAELPCVRCGRSW